jgi:hypothetical protein
MLRGTFALALAAFALSLAAGCGGDGGPTADETAEMLRQDLSKNGSIVHRVDCEQNKGDEEFWCAVNFSVQDQEAKGTMHVTCDRRAQRGEKCLIDPVPPPRCAQGTRLTHGAWAVGTRAPARCWPP